MFTLRSQVEQRLAPLGNRSRARENRTDSKMPVRSSNAAPADRQVIWCLTPRRAARGVLWRATVDPACHRRVGYGGYLGDGKNVDEDLLQRHAAGDPDAFVASYRRNLPCVLSFFLRRTGDPELTADLTAEVFAAALIAAPRFQPGETPASSWLYGIAAHKLSDSRRRGRVEDHARRRLAMEPLLIDDLELERVEEIASRASTELDSAIAQLPDEQRKALLARVVDQRTYPEIAAEMNCSELLVRQRVSRGLRRLRSRIKESG